MRLWISWIFFLSKVSQNETAPPNCRPQLPLIGVGVDPEPEPDPGVDPDPDPPDATDTDAEQLAVAPPFENRYSPTSTGQNLPRSRTCRLNKGWPKAQTIPSCHSQTRTRR